jgi:hypothetical protein
VDLAFSAAERALAAEFAGWLREHLVLPGSFGTADEEIAWGRGWQARLAADRWVGIDWPV